ncbi:hypothetical protein [Alteraurantiacibacter aquimixticola]|uniref:hypothetical protein n=1 Tax=Alteraurantiacibacter aquimixticola TaxID=2489173 RepID=UPI00145BA420|nr:hypothetical protein [Alteraurantiacibacter aquimixticola]
MDTAEHAIPVPNFEEAAIEVPSRIILPAFAGSNAATLSSQCPSACRDAGCEGVHDAVMSNRWPLDHDANNARI